MSTKLRLTTDDFVDDVYTKIYGTAKNREVMLSIVDESYQGNDIIGAINKINILTRTINTDGSYSNAQLCSSIVGIGNGTVGVIPDNSEDKGDILSKDNIANCTIVLYED